MRRTRILILLILTSSFLTPDAQTQQASKAPAIAASGVQSDALLRQPPTTLAGVEERRQLAREKLEALNAQTTAAPPQGDEAAERLHAQRLALRDAWQDYLASLDALAGVLEARERLGEDDRVRESAARLEEVRRRKRELEGAVRPEVASPEEAAASASELQERTQELVALNELQSRRTQQLSAGLRQRRESLEEELASLRKRRQQLKGVSSESPTPPTGDGTSRETEARSLEAAALDVRIARVEVDLQANVLERQLTEQASERDEAYQEALSEYVRMLGERSAALAEASSRSRLEIITVRRQRANDPLESVLLDLEYFAESVLLRYFRNQKLQTDLRERFGSTNLERLQHSVRMSSLTWEEIVSTMSQRSGQEALEFRDEVRSDRQRYEETRNRLQSRLASTLEDMYGLQRVRDRALQRFQELVARGMASLPEGRVEARAKLDAEKTPIRSRMFEGMKDTIEQVRELISRLKEGTSLVEEHLAQLRDYEAQLYRSALFRRQSGWVGVPWSRVRRELAALGTADGGDAVSPPPPAASTRDERLTSLEALLVEPDDPWLAVSAQFDQLVRSLREAPASAWGWYCALILLAAGVGGWLQLHARRRMREVAGALGDRSTVAEPDARATLAGVHRLGWKLAARLALPVSLAAALSVGLALLFPSTPGATAVAVVVSAVVASIVALVLVRVLFGARERLLPCSDRVAGHYRHWLEALIVLAGVLLPIIVGGHVLDVAPGLRSLARELFKTGLLLLVGGFLLRRERVLRVAGTAVRESSLGGLLAAIYPVFFFALVSLLVLGLAGYGILVEFVGTRVLATLAILLGVVVAVKYLNELVAWRLGRHTTTASTASSGDEGARPVDGAEEPDEGVAAVVPVRGIIATLGILAATWCILRVWGFPVLERLTFRTVILSLLALGAASIVDRLVARGLGSLAVSGRLPDAVCRMVRRWLRGVLLVVTVLLLVSIAGLPIGNIWTLISAGVAMIAIGFVAVWSVLSNIMSTLIILVWRPFQIGEQIHVKPEGIQGEVIDINFMYTLLRGEGDQRTTIPNSLFMQKFIERRPGSGQATSTLAEQLVADRPAGE